MSWLALLQQQPAQDWVNRGLMVTALLLVAALGSQLAGVTWLVVEGPNPPLPVLEQTARHAGSDDRVVGDPQKIASFNLFEVYQDVLDPAVSSLQEEKVPVTSLQLVLMGVVVSAPETSSAIIAEKGKAAQLYYLGKPVAGGSTLHEVYHDRVLLKRRGKLEALYFDENYKSSGSQRSSRNKSNASSSRGDPKVSRLLPSAMTRHNGRTKKASNPYELMQQMDINNIGKQELQQLSDAFGIEPVAAGRQEGYKLGSKVPRSMMARYGLRPGDIIVSINGNPVGNLSMDSSLVQELRSAGEAKVEIQRGKQRFKVTVPVPK